MPEHLRAMVAVLVIATAVFVVVRGPASALANPADLARRRNLWLALTLVAFAAHSFWIYAIASSTLLLFAAGRETNRVALFFFLLFVLPSTGVPIPGFGLVNFFFELSHVRILQICLLLPLFVSLLGRADVIRFGRAGPDKILAVYMLLVIVQVMREAPLTSVMRELFYQFIDVLVPYFVISRSLRTPTQFRDAMLSFVIAGMVLAALLVFETTRSWNLYRGVSQALGAPLDSLVTAARAGLLRAVGPTGHSIVAGYVMAIAFGFFLYLRPYIPSAASRAGGLLALLAGLAVSLSRGPWLGAAILLCAFVAMGKDAVKRLGFIGLGGTLLLLLLSVFPAGRTVVDLLPFIGETDAGSIDYRKQLLESSLQVIERNLWFGSINFAFEPELQALLQSQGIIDIVNTYILLTLERGIVGLGLFAGFFAVAAWGPYREMRRLPDKDGEAYLLGRALLATLAAVLAIIFTVSPISVVPLLFWSVAALCVGYTQMLRSETQALARTRSTVQRDVVTRGAGSRSATARHVVH